VAQVLLAAGADVNARNENGETPLDRARKWNKVDIVALLEQSQPLTKSAAQGGAGGVDQDRES